MVTAEQLSTKQKYIIWACLIGVLVAAGQSSFLGVLMAIVTVGIVVESCRSVRRNETNAQPHIQRFAAATYPALGPWPAPIRSPENEDILALWTLLHRQGISVPAVRLHKLVVAEALEQRRQRFAHSFLARNPHLPPCPSLEEWANAYVDTFENCLDYVSDVMELAQQRRARFNAHQLGELVRSVIRLRTHERRVAAVSHAMESGALLRRRTIADVDVLTGIEFEQFLGELFRAMGYQVEVTRASGDQGADLVLEKFGERTVVQAKCYSERVSNSAVQEAVAAKAFYRCHHAIVSTNNYYTESAQQLAAANGVALWDRDKLAHMISTYL